MEMSWIQRHILVTMLRREAARVKELRPADVPANQFSYHLDGLVTAGYITKSSRGTYEFTDKGVKLAGTFSTATYTPTENIKTVVTLYGRIDGKQLLFRWSRQPYMGKVTLPYDRMAFGTSLQAGIQSALQDKLGVVAPVEYMVSGLVTIRRRDVAISHMNTLVYRVDLSKVVLPYVSRNGEAFLADYRAEPGGIDGLVPFIDRIAEAKEPFDTEWRYE